MCTLSDYLQDDLQNTISCIYVATKAHFTLPSHYTFVLTEPIDIVSSKANASKVLQLKTIIYCYWYNEVDNNEA
jgi:hypothetical protein